MFSLCFKIIRAAINAEQMIRDCSLPENARSRGMADVETIEPRDTKSHL